MANERERFEAWAKTEGYSVDQFDRAFYTGLTKDTYIDNDLNLLWEGWQAHAESVGPAAKIEFVQHPQPIRGEVAPSLTVGNAPYSGPGAIESESLSGDGATVEAELKYAAESALSWMAGAIKMSDVGPLGAWVDPVTIDLLRIAISRSKTQSVMPKLPPGFEYTQPFSSAQPASIENVALREIEKIITCTGEPEAISTEADILRLVRAALQRNGGRQ